MAYRRSSRLRRSRSVAALMIAVGCAGCGGGGAGFDSTTVYDFTQSCLAYDKGDIPLAYVWSRRVAQHSGEDTDLHAELSFLLGFERIKGQTDAQARAILADMCHLDPDDGIPDILHYLPPERQVGSSPSSS